MTFTVWQVAAIMLAQGVLSELAAWAVRAWERGQATIAADAAATAEVRGRLERAAAADAMVALALQSLTDEEWQAILCVADGGL